MLDLEENQIIKNNDNCPLVIKKDSCKSNRFDFILTKEFFEKNNLSTSDKYIIKIKNKNNQKRYTKPAVFKKFKNNKNFYTSNKLYCRHMYNKN